MVMMVMTHRGSLTCDMPIWTAISMLKFINDELPMRDNVAFITYGGDSTAHDIWKNERQTVVNDTHIIYNLFNKYLSRPVYGTIGMYHHHHQHAHVQVIMTHGPRHSTAAHALSMTMSKMNSPV